MGARRRIIINTKVYGSGDESLKLRDWYGEQFCRRFKTKNYCGCGINSLGNKRLSHHGHYMRYSYRLLRRAKMAERR